jgi:hypothetical protein
MTCFICNVCEPQPFAARSLCWASRLLARVVVPLAGQLIAWASQVIPAAWIEW